MWSICKKEWRQFFSSLTGYLAIAVFLLLMGLFLFIFPDTSILDYGFATMDKFFDLAPWVLLLLIPAITMRSFPDEFRSGTWELLQTRPLTLGQIVLGKYLASLLLALLALVPTLVYVFTIQQLSLTGGIDTGGIIGSYIGLILLMASFTAIGIFCSSFTANSIVGFLAGALGCFILYNGFDALSRIPSFTGGADYYLEQLGIRYHYQSMSRGLIEVKDVVYFLVVTGLFLAFTSKRLGSRK
jgi:ABC-2 type transport system permease protein